MNGLAARTHMELDPNQFLSAKKGEKSSRSTVGFSETGSHYLVRFEMPEFLGDEVTVEVSNGELVVKGRDRPKGSKKAPEVSLKLETAQLGVFARYHEGVLVVALPKGATGSTSVGRVRR